ncbi:MAG: YceI family protein [Paucibacter sp.]|nr:YceI family protein [Roseateles sp.]
MAASRVVILAGLLAACSGAPQGPAVAVAADDGLGAAPACAGAPVAIDGAHSRLDVLVFRGGVAERLGHNHVAQAQDLAGWTCLPARADDGELAGTRFAFRFRLDALRLDDPAARAALGPGWATSLDAADVDGTRAHMLASLEAAKYPWVSVRSVSVAWRAPALAAEVEIDLHGQRRRVPLALDVQPAGKLGAWTARGTLAIRQSDWGIEPYAVLGGLLAVRDELVIRFALQTNPVNGSTTTLSPAATGP